MREMELDLYLENFRAIAEERMAELTVSPELKERWMQGVLEAGAQKKSKVAAFVPRRNRAAWGAVAVAAALLVAVAGSGRLSGGETPPRGMTEVAEDFSNYGVTGGNETAGIGVQSEEGEYATPEALPPPLPEAPAQADVGVPESAKSGALMLPPPTEPAAGISDEPEDVEMDAADDGAELRGEVTGDDWDEGEVAESTGDDVLADQPLQDNMEIWPVWPNVGNSLPNGGKTEEAEAEEEDCDESVEDVESDSETLHGVTAVFTGQVVSVEEIAISLKTGLPLAQTAPELPQDQLQQEALEGEPDPKEEAEEVEPVEDPDAPAFLPGYARAEGDVLYVTVTTYRIDGVHHGVLAAETLLRVLGASGPAGSVELVAIASVSNREYGGVLVRYDAIANAAPLWTGGDTSAEAVERLLAIIPPN